MAERFCKDCKHYGIVAGTAGYEREWKDWPACRSPRLGKNLVTGESINAVARMVRDDATSCGHRGAWFEPINPEPLPPPRKRWFERWIPA